MRVLLSDGSGLTSRQCAGLLGAAGHRVGVLAPGAAPLARATRYVRQVHRVPRYGADPLAWMDAALAVLDRGGYDVLLPTHEQVAVLARYADEVAARGVRTATPSFPALARALDKLAADDLLAELGITRPEGHVARTPDELRAARPPVYVKAPVGTASAGVHLAVDHAELARLADRFAELDPAGLGGVLVQRPVSGRLLMVQAVFERGRLVAAHANSRDRTGAGNGATHKTSQPLGPLRPLLERLGDALLWHGGLSLDVIEAATGPVVIDVNPRLVEPGNAAAAGVDLVGAFLAVAAGDGSRPAVCADGQVGVRTHQYLLALASVSGRRAVLSELGAVLARRGGYRGSVEELTPARRDPAAGLLMAALTSALLVRPGLRDRLAAGAVDGYALGADGWRRLLETST